MRSIQLFAIIAVLLASSAACNTLHASEAAPSSLTFVRSILNASPSAVQLKLGKPDRGIKRTADCTDPKMRSCDEATYQNGKFEAIFYSGRLKGLFIYRDDLFGKNALELVGFTSAPPTWANQHVQSWRNAAHRGTATGPLIPIQGIDEINVFPSNRANNYRGFMAISVGLSYDKSFAK